MRKLFGTDGIRGIANQYPMTGEMAIKLGRAVAHIVKQRSGKHRIVIGKDTRLSGYMLESALTAGICSFGVDVLLTGPLPTPAIAFLTRSMRADAGVVISASHNLFEDNGMKFFSKDGLKLPDETEYEIERLIMSGEIDHIRPTAHDIGKAYRVDDSEGRYIEFVKNSLPKGFDLQGMNVVIDCGNGAVYKTAPLVLQELGVQLNVINDAPDGVNINRDCGAVCPAGLQKAVLAHHADIGIAYDGDADRAVFVDEKGNVVPGEVMLVVLAQALHKEKKLLRDTLVTTEMSNTGIEKYLEAIGVTVTRVNVGDRYVLEKMLAGGYNFGGESSGHTIFLDHHTTGDGLITTLQWLALMKNTGRPLSQWTDPIKLLPQILANIKVREKKPLSEILPLQQVLDRTTALIGRNGRLIVRYSGTESLLRVMIEGEDQALLSTLAQEITTIVTQQIGLFPGRGEP